MIDVARRAARVNRPRKKRRRNDGLGWGNAPSNAPPSSSRRTCYGGDHPDAARIIAALGGYGGMCRCPCHDDRKPSLSVDYRNGRVLVKCFAGCSQATLVEYFKGRGLWPRSGTPSPRTDRVADSEPKESAVEQRRERRANRDSPEGQRASDAEGRRERALAVLDAADPDEWRKLRAYLRGRGLDTVPEGARWLSQRDARRLADEYPQLSLKRFPAMIFPVVRAGVIVGAHATFLCSDGSKKLACEDPRRTLGPIKGGCVILGKPHRDLPLIIGEGIESSMAKMQLDGWPGIAAMNAGNMADLNLINLPPCASIIIAADNDRNKVGINAARILGRRLAACGYTVRIDMPERPKHWKKERSYDFADHIQ